MLRGFTRTFDRWAELASVCGCAAGVVVLSASPACAGPDPAASLPSQMALVGIASSGDRTDVSDADLQGAPFTHSHSVSVPAGASNTGHRFMPRGHAADTQHRDASAADTGPPARASWG